MYSENGIEKFANINNAIVKNLLIKSMCVVVVNHLIIIISLHQICCGQSLDTGIYILTFKIKLVGIIKSELDIKTLKLPLKQFFL